MRALMLSVAAKFMQAELKGEDTLFTGVCTDSRQLLAGDLFVALKGARVDGHDCIQEAEARGAKGVVVNRPVKTALPTLSVKNTLRALGQLGKGYRDSFQIPMVAITGSCGKTTVKEMINSILSLQGRVLATQGNLNTEVGVPLTLLGLNETHTAAVVEMGARCRGDIAYLMSLATPTISIITNAGVAHIGVFGSERDIAEAKGEIFQNLQKTGIAVINNDDIHAEYWRSLLQGQRVISFGLQKGAIVSAQKILLEPKYSRFELITDVGNIDIHLQIPGEHSIQNALAAAAASRAFSVSLTTIKEGLERFLPVTGRLQQKIGPKGALIIDDTYNANPVSMRAALRVLAKYPGKTIFVMGDMFELGGDTVALHQKMGEEAKHLRISKILGIGEATAKAIEAFGEGGSHYLDKPTLIAALLPELDEGTTVLVKGSLGMRMSEIVLALTTKNQELKTC